MEYVVIFRLVSVLLISFPQVQCSGTVAMRLDHYSNPASIVADGKGTCCDALVFCSSSHCDPFFRLCYTHIGSKRFCDILKKQTSPYDDAKEITFGNMIGDMHNPTTSRFTSSQKVGVSVKITVVDHDSTGEDIIEELNIAHRFQHGDMVTPSKYKNSVLMRGRACQVRMTISVECDPGWYGQQCDKTCQEFKMPLYQDMYGCDHNGYIVSCKHDKTICQQEKTTTSRPIEVTRATSASTTTLPPIFTTSLPQKTTPLFVHVTQSQRPNTETSSSDLIRFIQSTETSTQIQRYLNSNKIGSTVSTNSSTASLSNDSPVTTDDVMQNISHVSNRTEPPCMPVKKLRHIRNSLLLTFGVAHNVSLPHNKRNLTWALESWKRKSNVNNFTASIAGISGSYFSLIVTVSGGVSLSTLLEDVLDKGGLQERIEETIGHSIFPANRSFCSPSVIKQVKWSRTEGAGDRSSSIIGAVMGVLVLGVSTAAIGIVYHWYVKHKRKVFPENSSAELQLVEESSRD